MKTLFSADAIELTIILSVLLLGAAIFFLMQSVKGSKSGGTQQTKNGIVSDDKPTPFYKVHRFKFAAIFFVFWIGAMVYVWNDYRPHIEWLDGKIPERTIDSTRMSAQDMIDLQTKK